MTYAPVMDRAPARLTNKVPLVTATFWVIKILSTTVGETFADYLTVNVGLGVAVTDGLVFAVLAAALTWQLRARKYTPWIYWLTVVLISISGTQITDFFTDTVGVSLYVSSAVFAALLAVVFFVWHRQEMTLAITSINTRRREAFYWGAILVTFALGTAAGDLATEALSLGFTVGSLLFGGAFLVTLVAWRLGAGPVAGFWVAYILTRPLGASLGDLLTQDRSLSGLGLGAIRTSALFLIAIVLLVAREQVVAIRDGVATDKSTAAPRRADLGWAAGAVAAVAAAAVGLSATAGSPAAAVTAAATGSSDAAAAPDASAAAAAAGSAAAGGSGQKAVARSVHRSKLGDLTRFAVIVDDVTAKAKAGDLPAATTRIKDLEVAWDESEAGLKPRSPAQWHLLDGRIDGALTALRAGTPVQTDCVTALTQLRAAIATVEAG